MKRSIQCLFLSAALLFAVPLTQLIGAEINTEKSDPTLDSFRAAMNEQIRMQEGRIQTLKRQVLDRTVAPASIHKVQLANAITMLDVKKTLVSNFMYNPVSSSQRVQMALLEVLGKDMITEADLAQVQSIVNEERARMGSRAIPPTAGKTANVR